MRFTWLSFLFLFLPVCSTYAEEVGSTFHFSHHFINQISFKTNTLGQAGELFPKEYFEELLRLGLPHEAEEDYKNLRATDIQIDPASTYPNQIQVKWQVLKDPDSSSSSTKRNREFQSVFHTYYNIPAEEFQTLLRGLQRFKFRLSSIQEGMNEQELQEIFLAFIGANRISKISFLTPQKKSQRNKNPSFDFGVFEIVGGKMVRSLP